MQLPKLTAKFQYCTLFDMQPPRFLLCKGIHWWRRWLQPILFMQNHHQLNGPLIRYRRPPDAVYGAMLPARMYKSAVITWSKLHDSARCCLVAGKSGGYESTSWRNINRPESQHCSPTARSSGKTQCGTLILSRPCARTCNGRLRNWLWTGGFSSRTDACCAILSLWFASHSAGKGGKENCFSLLRPHSSV